MLLSYLIAADVVAIVHAAYVTFVIGGLALILIGIARGWEWVRGPWFRVAHLAAIVIVCAQWFAGMTCPLTELENRLREMAGGTGYPHNFVGYWVDWLIFYDLPRWVFSVAYTTFALIVAGALIIAPPRRLAQQTPAAK
jgi:multisubunit Na+/H+ antiporter MnhB subunit